MSQPLDIPHPHEDGWVNAGKEEALRASRSTQFGTSTVDDGIVDTKGLRADPSDDVRLTHEVPNPPIPAPRVR